MRVKIYYKCSSEISKKSDLESIFDQELEVVMWNVSCDFKFRCCYNKRRVNRFMFEIRDGQSRLELIHVVGFLCTADVKTFERVKFCSMLD